MDNAIYTKVASGPPPSYDGGPRYVSLADTAKLMRGALAAAFPGTKFYVRSQGYSGGSSVRVYYDGVAGDGTWTRVDFDGVPYGDPVPYDDIDRSTGRWDRTVKSGAPAKRAVEAVLAGYEYKRFDGMIDLAYNVKSWLLPDGSAALGKSAGTAGSRGSDPGYDYDAPDPRALLVSFGAGYVFVDNELPYDVRKGAA